MSLDWLHRITRRVHQGEEEGKKMYFLAPDCLLFFIGKTYLMGISCPLLSSGLLAGVVQSVIILSTVESLLGPLAGCDLPWDLIEPKWGLEAQSPYMGQGSVG